MKKIGQMSVLEHIVCAMEDLNNEKNFESQEPDKPADLEKMRTLIDKAKGIAELSKSYSEILKIEQEEKRLRLDAYKLIAEHGGGTVEECRELLGLPKPSNLGIGKTAS